MPELLANGSLELGWLSVRDEPVAAFYNFRHDGRVYFYQSGRKLDIPDAVRVGVTMHAYLLRAAIEDGMREYDFLAGASQYKMALALSSRPIVRLRVVRSTIREAARRASERHIADLKRARDWARREVGPRAPARIRPLLDPILGVPPKGAETQTETRGEST
jgi:hypothetical protein